jgi:hypothetical protein
VNTPQELLVAYCERIDAGDFDGVGELFSEGSIADDQGRQIARGAEAVAAFYRSTVILHDGSPRTKHLVLNTVFDEEAVARSSYLVLQALDGFGLQPIICGGYRDTFSRTPEGWRFAERRFSVDLVGDLSRHLR